MRYEIRNRVPNNDHSVRFAETFDQAMSVAAEWLRDVSLAGSEEDQGRVLEICYRGESSPICYCEASSDLGLRFWNADDAGAHPL